MSDQEPTERIEPSEVRAALDSIVGSDTFGRSDRAKAMIRYLVEQELAGNADTLKGFVIAQDVFGRSDDFDPAMDAVVRVQAGRLRDQLQNYYGAEGADDPIQISVPRGSYVPVYARATNDEANDAEAGGAELDFGATTSSDGDGEDAGKKGLRVAPVAPPINIDKDTPVSPFIVSNVRRFWAVLLSILALLILILGLVWRNTNQLSDDLTARRDGVQQVERLNELPSVLVRASEPEPDNALISITSEIASGMGRFRTLSVRAEGAGGDPADGAEYGLTVAPAEVGGFTITLVNNESGEFIFRDTIAEPSQTEIARILSAIAPSGGLIYRDANSRGILSSNGACLLGGQDFFLNQTLARFEDALQCTGEALEAVPDNSLLMAMRADLIVESVRNRYKLPDGIDLQLAKDIANRATEVDRLLPQAHRSMGNIFMLENDFDPAIAQLLQATEINPYDLALGAAYGFALYKSGDCETALPVLDRSADNAINPPSWWSYTRFLCAFDTGSQTSMAEASADLARFDRSYYLAARAISADINGNEDLRDTLIARLGEKNTGLTRDPQSYYQRYLPDGLSSRMYWALQNAGFSGPEG